MFLYCRHLLLEQGPMQSLISLITYLAFIIMNKMIIFLFFLALNSDPLCTVYFGAVRNLQRSREEHSIVLSHLHYLLPPHLPILTLSKSGFPLCWSIWETFTFHIKNEYTYINTYTLYRQCYVPSLQSL